jgi:hypothetical protein
VVFESLFEKLRNDSSEIMGKLARDNLVAKREDIDSVSESDADKFPYLFA